MMLLLFVIVQVQKCCFPPPAITYQPSLLSLLRVTRPLTVEESCKPMRDPLHLHNVLRK